MSDLRRTHTEHLTPRFGKDFSGEEREIEIQTEDIKRVGIHQSSPVQFVSQSVSQSVKGSNCALRIVDRLCASFIDNTIPPPFFCDFEPVNHA